MNPELRRMLWLEVSLQRLWLIPAVIVGMALLLRQSGAGPAFVHGLALFGFVVLTVIWGARQVANAVLDEVREHTWEIQRMSALSPWSMTWGKLLGATAMPWYAGLICLALFVALDNVRSAAESLCWALLAVLGAIAVQAFALTTALVSVHLERRLRARLNIAIVLFLLTLLLPELAGLTVPGFGPLREIGGVLSWYGTRYDGVVFNLVLFGTLALWALVGAYRMMCLELEVRTTPWVWLAFIIFLAAVFSGFEHDHASADPGRLCSSAAVFACALSYVAGFAFTRDPVQYRRVLQAIREARYRRALEELPLWMSSAAYALLFALVATAIGSDSGLTNERVDNLGPVALALALFMVRDLSVLTYCSFRQRTRRAEITTLVYLALLNRLIPAIFVLAGLGQLRQLIKPALFDNPGIAIAVGAVHTALAVWLVSTAYRAAMRESSQRA